MFILKDLFIKISTHFAFIRSLSSLQNIHFSLYLIYFLHICVSF